MILRLGFIRVKLKCSYLKNFENKFS